MLNGWRASSVYREVFHGNGNGNGFQNGTIHKLVKLAAQHIIIIVIYYELELCFGHRRHTDKTFMARTLKSFCLFNVQRFLRVLWMQMLFFAFLLFILFISRAFVSDAGPLPVTSNASLNLLECFLPTDLSSVHTSTLSPHTRAQTCSRTCKNSSPTKRELIYLHDMQANSEPTGRT